MGRNNYFQFKQFRILQEKAAMKVNTDGVLLGSWVSVKNPETILDIGAGTGVIALMLAQRSNAKITAVEIEENAAREAEQNVIQSKWNDRTFVYHTDFVEFAQTCDSVFDLIVTNPPFFSNGVKNKCQNKSIARHNHVLPFSELIKGVIQILHPEGLFAAILPNDEANIFAQLAETERLFLSRITEIKPNPVRESNRVLMEFSMQKTVIQKDSLTIYNEKGDAYSEQYKNLTRDFYPNF